MLDTAIRLKRLKSLIHNTPLLAIDFLLAGARRTIYAKAEHLNMSGSIKDRIAYGIMDQAYQDGELSPAAPIIEVTSGNTGIAFAALGRNLGHPVTIFMPDWVSRERYNILKAYGADIVTFGKECSLAEVIGRAEELAEDTPGAFLPRQFASVGNIQAHYSTTGPEIWWQLKFHGLTPQAFVAGVGTGGTVMGVGAFLKEMAPAILAHPLEPKSAPLLSSGTLAGEHRIEGISDGYLPPLLNLASLDRVIGVADGDAIIMAQKLDAELGLGVGISSGANFLGAVLAQNDLGGEAVVATVFADDNKKYLSTDLLRTEQPKNEYLAPRIELLSVQALKRVCYTCCEPEECLAAAPLACTEEFPPPVCPRRK